MQVAKWGMLSLVAVFRDILPGYRIRPPTEKELTMPVSKEVKKTRDYEATLLRSYQACLCQANAILIIPTDLDVVKWQCHSYARIVSIQIQ